MYTKRLLAMPVLIVYRHGIGTANIYEKLLYKSTCPREGGYVKLLVHETLSYICDGSNICTVAQEPLLLRFWHIHEELLYEISDPQESQLCIDTVMTHAPSNEDHVHEKLLYMSMESYRTSM